MPRYAACFLLLITLSQPAFATGGVVVNGDHSGRKFFTLKPQDNVVQKRPVQFFPLKPAVKPQAMSLRATPVRPAKVFEKSELKPEGKPAEHKLTQAQAQQILAIFAAKE